MRQSAVFGEATVSSLQVVILAAALGLMALLHFFVEHTKMGKAMRACSDDIEPPASWASTPTRSSR